MTYPKPVVTGGEEPLSVVCTPASGSAFEEGESSVWCVVIDGRQRTASCPFTVTVAPVVRRLSATRFVAFGDSITEGKLALGPLLLIPNPSFSYPFRLQLRLAERYRRQTFEVLDEGYGGERIEAGVVRLPRVLDSDNPQVLLLMEGVNNLNAERARAIPDIVDGLRTMIRMTRARGIPVFVATLLPQREGGSRAWTPTLIQPTNDQIRTMVVAEGAVLVDLYPAFVGKEDTLLGGDGLHPSEAGYDQMAATFFDSIQANLEVGQSFGNVTPMRLTPTRDGR